MIDTLIAMRRRLDPDASAAAHGVRRGEYLVVTLHRPALVDGPLLAEAIGHLTAVAASMFTHSVLSGFVEVVTQLKVSTLAKEAPPLTLLRASIECRCRPRHKDDPGHLPQYSWP